MAQPDRPYTVRIAPLFQAECVQHGAVAPVRDRSGAALIALERQRQIDAEGYQPRDDARHVDESLALAACSYAIPRTWRRWKQSRDAEGPVPTTWPWDAAAWRPTQDDRIRELVKAGALVAAEIDRLQARK